MKILNKNLGYIAVFKNVVNGPGIFENRRKIVYKNLGTLGHLIKEFLGCDISMLDMLQLTDTEKQELWTLLHRGKQVNGRAIIRWLTIKNIIEIIDLQELINA